MCGSNDQARSTDIGTKERVSENDILYAGRKLVLEDAIMRHYRMDIWGAAYVGERRRVAKRPASKRATHTLNAFEDMNDIIHQ
jgi:hypothetical protein